MVKTPILPDIGTPVRTDILNQKALKTASIGELIYALTMLMRIVMDRIANASTFYNETAVYKEASGADWSGFKGDVEDQQKPIIKVTPPDNYCDSIPGIGHMLKQIDRGFDAIMTHYTRYVERGLSQHTTYMGIPFEQAPFRNTKQYFVEVLQFSGYRATKLVDRAAWFAPAHGRDHQHARSQPKFPAFAQAMARGQIAGENADRIIDLDKQLTKYARKVGKPTDYKDMVLQAFEPTLIEVAETSSPDALSKAKHRWMERIAYEIDIDGPSPSQVLRKQADNAIKSKDCGDGSGVISMHATPSVFAAFKTLIAHQRNWDGKAPFIPEDIAAFLHVEPDAPAADNNANDANTNDEAEFDPEEIVGEDDYGNPVTAGYMKQIDAMTEGQKFGAYLIGALRMLFSMDPAEAAIKRAHGAHAQLVIVQDIETAHKMLGLPLPDEAKRPPGPDGIRPPTLKRNDTGLQETINNAGVSEYDGPWTAFQSEAINVGPMHPKDGEPLGCEADIVAQIWNGPDTVLNQKRTYRLFTAAQRRAIIARDRGCQAPGCMTPAALCDIHHIIEWLSGGKTDVDNAITLCPTHHAAVHNGKWTIRKTNGLTFFQPALWLDPSRPLLRNIYWNV